ncbi:hypothetical protein ACVRXF_01280 [Streptococcus orisasini]
MKISKIKTDKLFLDASFGSITGVWLMALLGAQVTFLILALVLLLSLVIKDKGRKLI